MPALEVSFSKRASQDLRNIQLHYLACGGDPQQYLAQIFEGVEKLAEFPDLGRQIESRGNIMPGYRKFLKDEFWIYYSSADSKLVVWRVAHQKQDIDDYALLEV